MKYLVSWKPRQGGSSAEHETTVERSLQVLSKWTPPADETFHQFLARLDGEGGYAVVETDSALSLLDGPANFGPYFEFSIVPVVDMTEGVAALQQGSRVPPFARLRGVGAGSL